MSAEVGADEVAGWLGELLPLSRIEKVNRSPADKKRIIDLSRLLRGADFSNQEIGDFTEGKLPLGSVKRWTEGVEVKNTSGKEELLGALRAFVGGGHKVEDLAGYVEAKKEMTDVVTFAEVTKFAKNINKLDVDENAFFGLYQEYADTGLKGKKILETIALRKKLDDKGLKEEVETVILKAADKHGDAEGVLKMIAAAETKHSIMDEVEEQKKIRDGYAQKITLQRGVYERLVNDTDSYRGHIEVAKTLQGKSFDNNACNELIKAAERFGSAPGVIGAVNGYNSLKELDSVVEGKKAEIESMGNAVKRLQGENEALLKQNAEANQLLGQIDEKYRQSKYLQDVARIVQDPQGSRIPPANLARLGISFLTGLMICAEATPDQSRKLSSSIKTYSEYIVATLRDYLRGV